MDKSDTSPAMQEAFDAFERWLELDNPARVHLLARVARDDPALHARVTSLIRADEAADQAAFLGDSAMLDVVASQSPDAERDHHGHRIDAWVLERSLGSGGMGHVWLARRNDGQHRGVAAIKMLRVAVADAHANERFAQEGRILAQLAHPHIAMLLDAGFTIEGQRYLVLEYIDGERIDEWCDARSLGIEGRLALFLQVCAAVAHAHAHLVVHRDLKPSNILVQHDGSAKLLDFGVAKLLEQDGAGSATLTVDAMAALTPGYAAPEQITGAPITTATDVYGLGVILYRLLSGRGAHGPDTSTPAQLTRAALEKEPRRLSDFGVGEETVAIAANRDCTPERLRRALRGDLDVIVAKALKKTPAERYASAEALADDVRRHLDHRPIAARADSALYRLRRFARRNWLPLGTAAMLMLVVIVSAAMVAAQARQLTREAQTTLAVKDFLFGLFSAVDPNETKGKEFTARELLDRGRQRVGEDSRDDPALKAELQSVLGRIYGALGSHADAGDLQKHAIGIFEAERGSPLLLAQTRIDYADSLRELGDLKGASATLGEASASLHALSTPSPKDDVRVLSLKAKIAVSQRDFAQARRDADAGVSLARVTGVGDYLLGDGLWNAGSANWGLGDLDAAEKDYREALVLMERTQGHDSPRIGKLHDCLAMVARGRSDYPLALEEEQQSIAILEKSLAPDHPVLVAVHASLGLTYFHLGRYREAREVLEGAIAAQRKQGEDSPALAGTLINLGDTLVESSDLDAADRAFSESLRIWEKRYGRDYPGAQVALGGLGKVALMQGRIDLALVRFTQVREQSLKDSRKIDAPLEVWLGEVKRLDHDLPAALEIDRQALADAPSSLGARRVAALAHHAYGLALRDSGDEAAATRELRAALSSFHYIPNAEHPTAATTRLELALMLAQHPEARAEALRLSSDAASIRERMLGADNPLTADARASVARIEALH
jgi:tetratricopeptide (TPR) repeat protein